MRDKLNQAYAVAATEWSYLFRSGVLWKLSGAHLTVVSAALLLSWPGLMFSFQAPPMTTWRAYLLSEVAFTAYVALGLSADLIGRDRRVRARDWVGFRLCAPGPLLLGRLVALSMALASVYLAALPVALLACAAHPFPLGRFALFGVVLLPHAALLSFLGASIGASFRTGSEGAALRRRSMAQHGLFALLAAVTLTLRPLVGDSALQLLNPLSAIDAFFPADGGNLALVPPSSPWTWSAWALGSALASLSAGVWARRSLAPWAREGSASDQEKPLGEHLPNAGGG